MASPVGDSYAVASGGVIAAGRYHWPAWRREMSAGTIAQIGSNKLSDLNPKNNPAINPNYPNNPEWSGTGDGFQMIVLAWCGAVWDEQQGLFALPLSGGHADYGGNEGYKIRLLDESPVWSMPRPPSGAIGNLLTTNDGQESTGNYADGRPRAIHSYNKFAATPAGVILAVQGGTYYSAQSGTYRTMLWDVASGEWETKTTHPSPGASTSGCAACYDSLRNRVWYKPCSDGNVSWLNLDTWQWTEQTSWGDNSWAYKRLVYLPEHDLVFQADSNKTGGFCVWSPVNGTIYQPGSTGSPPVGLTLSGISGCDWNGSRLLVWHNVSNTTTIGTLTPTGNPTTDPWVWGSLSFSGVTPSVAASNGTYGRFAYSKRLKGCILQNEVAQKTYFFAIE